MRKSVNLKSNQFFIKQKKILTLNDFLSLQHFKISP